MTTTITTRAEALLEGMLQGPPWEKYYSRVSGSIKLSLIDRDFIAAAPSLVRELCEEVERLQKRLNGELCVELDDDAIKERIRLRFELEASNTRAAELERQRDRLAGIAKYACTDGECPMDGAPCPFSDKDCEYVSVEDWLEWAAAQARSEGEKV